LDLNGALNTVKAKYGLELPHVDYACSVIPMLVRGDVHAAVRKSFALFLAGRLAELDQRLHALVKASLAPFGRKGRVDIVAQVVNPLVRGVFSTFLGSEMPSEFLTIHVIEILTFKALVAHLRSLEARLGKMLSYLRATTSGEDEIACKLICLVFGVDSVSMMLTESLVMALRATPAAARLPDYPRETGVPVLQRVANRDFEIDGHKFAAGDLIRLQMQSLGYSEHADHRKVIFGAAAHTCLGKHVSLRIWDVFRDEFNAMVVSGRVVDYKLSPSHFIIFHESVEVEVF
jgi:hypothetical protein